MVEYYIPNLIVGGVVFKSEQPLSLNKAVELAKEFKSRGYTFHVDEKTSEKHYKMKLLSELEKLLEKQQ